MTTTFLKNISHLACFNDDAGGAGTELTDAGILMRDNVIEKVGPMAGFSDITADRVIDLSGHVVMPGMVNTHHHFYQNLTRVMVQDDPLFVWLKTLYPIWANIDDAAIETTSRMAMAELIASGCTTSSDHQYIMPNDCTLDTPIRVAQEMGLRFHAARGAMSRGESQGGLPPDSCVENEEAILKDAERLIHTYHDMSEHAMTRIVMAPCSPFSVTPGLMKEAAQLARSFDGVRLHSHIAEVLDEEIYCNEMYGMRSVEFAESVGWLGDDVWFAHAIFLNDAEIKAFADSGTGATFCPSAHMRCGLGIMRAREMLDVGVTVGLGVDGSASNDTSNMFLEARMGMMLQRVAPNQYLSEAPGGRGGFGGTPAAMSVREVLNMATRGGAKLLGRTDIGQIATGKSADVIAVNLNQLGLAGTQRDPLAALVMCGPFEVDYSFINGVPVIEKKQFTRLDVEKALDDHARNLERIYDA
jgi:cytosine/adenosine deaminase-related metal-dependent hydrolase